MQLVAGGDGTLRCVYDETLDVSQLGQASIRRASHVEPTDHGLWQADLSPVNGPLLGPFALRSEALTAEIHWLHECWLNTDSPE